MRTLPNFFYYIPWLHLNKNHSAITRHYTNIMVLQHFAFLLYLTICTFSGTLTVEEVYKDRDQFASLVREVAAPDVGRMGIEVLSFTIKDVYDNVTYLASLGKKFGETRVVKCPKRKRKYQVVSKFCPSLSNMAYLRRMLSLI